MLSRKFGKDMAALIELDHEAFNSRFIKGFADGDCAVLTWAAPMLVGFIKSMASDLVVIAAGIFFLVLLKRKEQRKGGPKK